MGYILPVFYMITGLALIIGSRWWEAKQLHRLDRVIERYAEQLCLGESYQYDCPYWYCSKLGNLLCGAPESAHLCKPEGE